MTTMTSPPPQVPYQAYKSKRHSRNFSNQGLPIASSPSPTRPSSVAVNGFSPGTPASPPAHPAPPVSQNEAAPKSGRRSSVDGPLASIRFPTTSVAEGKPTVKDQPIVQPKAQEPVSTSTVSSATTTSYASPRTSTSPLPTIESSTTVTTPKGHVEVSTVPPSPSTSTMSLPSQRTSTFRHLPSRQPTKSMVSSPLRPPGSQLRAVSLSNRHFDQASISRASPHSQSIAISVSRNSSAESSSHSNAHSSSSTVSVSRAHSPQPPPKDHPKPHSHIITDVVAPPPRGASLPIPQLPPKSSSPVYTASSYAATASSSPASTPSRSQTPVRTPAPYLPGFQPRGVIRPLTDHFLEARRALRDEGRVERTRLERRLEKLINLHFGTDAEKRVVEKPRQSKRISSIFDFDIKDLRNVDAGDLWRGVIQSQVAPGSKADIRAAEQHITPWEDDAAVSQCPLCTASFHPITNRKHHCRLCGRIICALPPKRPQRSETCSLLFVADPKTGQIEEVGEGVDYGVRRRSGPVNPGKSKTKEELGDEEKFLKGVRICRDCRPILLRQQHFQESQQTPTFAKLYDAFINLEKEIEESLPLFQELLLTLSNDNQPTAEASAARKRLLEAFAQYDALAKRIRKLPTPGPGSSRDRVQGAILTRANIFLQKNMFPLQSLPKPKKATSSPVSSAPTPEPPVIDPDSEVAHALQPLLEQEALLETFVQEAKAHRKFEDAKTLKVNLQEIRTEIDRIFANTQNGGKEVNGKAQDR